MANKTVTLSCRYCLKPFTFEIVQKGITLPAYCKKGHREKARLKRNKSQPKKCPYPTKKVFASVEHAQGFINWRYSWKEAREYAPYKCRCGDIHIGHGAYYVEGGMNV